MDKSEEALEELGLTPTEAKLYLAGLSGGSMTIQNLGAATHIKRPTIYHALSTLREKGLVAEKRLLGKAHFSMSAPATIAALLERRKEKIERQAQGLGDLIPLLESLRGSAAFEEISVVEYSGIDGMKTAMDIALYCKSRRWDIIAPFDNFLRKYDKTYAKKYLAERARKGITSRTLWEDSMREGRKLTQAELTERNPRLMPWVMHGKFKSMLILFDDKVAIFSSYEKQTAMIITSKDLHALFQAMFNGLWEFSEQY